MILKYEYRIRVQRMNIVKKINDYINKNTELCLFLLCLIIYIPFGLYNNYFCDAVTNINWDLIYGIDTGKTFWHMYLNDGFMTLKHPLIHIFVCPVISIEGSISKTLIIVFGLRF